MKIPTRYRIFFADGATTLRNGPLSAIAREFGRKAVKVELARPTDVTRMYLENVDLSENES